MVSGYVGDAADRLRLAVVGFPIAKRLASGAFWSLVGEGGARALAFGATVVVARSLGVADLGAFTLVQATLAMLATFALFGMGHTATRYVAALRDKEPSRVQPLISMALWFSLVSGAIASAALFFVAPYASAVIFAAPQLEIPLMLAAPIVLLMSLSGTMTGVALGFEAFKQVARLRWISSVVNLLCVCIGVAAGGLTGALAGLLVGEVARAAIVIWLTRLVMTARGFSISCRTSVSEFRTVWAFSLPLLLGSLLHAPVLWACQAIIAARPDGLAEVGVFNASQKWMTVIILVPMAASAALSPVLANLSAGGSKAAFKRTTRWLAAVQFTAAGIPAMVFAARPTIALSVFGEEFESGAPVMVAMMVLAPIFVLRHLYWQAITSQGRAWSVLWLSALWAVVAVFGAWLGRDAGALGLANAMIAAYATSLIVSVILVEFMWRH